MGCEHRSPNETHGSSADRVARDRRQPPLDVVQRAEQPRASTEHGVSARDSSWGDKREPVHTVGLLRRQLSRDQPAERMTDEIDAVEFGRFEPTPEPTCQLGRGKSPA
jgi:hypothetical protein